MVFKELSHIYTIPQANLEKLGVTGLYPKTGFTEGNLKLYLQNPPSGIYIQYNIWTTILLL